MKRILAVGIAAAFLIGTLAPMAAAGVFQADMISTNTLAKCGTVQIVGNLVILSLNLSGANCTPGSTTDLALCTAGGSPEKLTLLTDANGNGKISGNEGVLRGVLSIYTTVSGLEVFSGVQAGDFFCTTNGSQEYDSGWHK